MMQLVATSLTSKTACHLNVRLQQGVIIVILQEHAIHGHYLAIAVAITLAKLAMTVVTDAVLVSYQPAIS